ncbi:NADP-dependent oxidoreductase [Amnibacterium kyonggiense]|uniref:NADPH:quinone reductase-like Zn-dependent oxidoreductase n=1 Tax=Amnibacterium kyonggiense TaxID=595671 RepID=A0A4R7FPC7_9MICO|nr:NADP-dependent oxidoreductase [Amnibacterium kyonggiense]TDS79591.1 NADPH:quinone reductase-like Zn-dependent oxidoreductase [Amnibacterium kyonggiense]
MTLHGEVAVAAPSATGGTMRAAVLDRFGDAGALRVIDVARPVPVVGELLVRVVAAGVNPIDLKTRAGGGEAAGVAGFPAVLGYDFSGVVISAPYEAFRLQPGDEVFGISNAPRATGSFAEYLTVPAQQVASKPKILSHAEAAAVPLAALTAWGAVVELAKAHEGQRILIHAGAGGVGHLAVQFAAYFGAHVIATASGRNTNWLRELGASETIDHTTNRFEDVVAEVDTVIDLVGDQQDRTGPRSLDVLRPGGLLVNVPSGSWPTLMDDARRAGVRATSYRMVPDAATLAVIGRLINSGDVRVSVQEVFPLDRIADAQRLLEAGHVRGKVVVQVADY